jgi:hypothetical protein
MPSPTQKPLTMTIDDFHQTRHSSTTQHMHWPVDEDTRRRLAKVVLYTEERLPWQRRLLRWLTITLRRR